MADNNIIEKTSPVSSVWPLLNAAYRDELRAVQVAKARRGDDMEPPIRIPVGAKLDIQERPAGQGRACQSDGDPLWLAGHIAYTVIECTDTSIQETDYGFERIYEVLIDEQETVWISEALALRAFGDAYAPKPLYSVDTEFVAHVGTEEVSFRVAWGGRRDHLPYPIPLELKGGIRHASGHDIVYIVECDGQLAGVVTEMGLYRLISAPCRADVTVKAFPTSLSIYLTLCGESVHFPLTTHSGKWLRPSFERLLAASPAVLPLEPGAIDFRLGRCFHAGDSWHFLVSEMVSRSGGWKQWMVWRMSDGALSRWLPQTVLLDKLRSMARALDLVETRRVS